MICEIGDPDAFEAVLVIDQGDVQLVRVGQPVDMKFDSRRLDTFSGMITEKSNEPIDSATSMSMSSQTGGDLQTEIDPTTGQVKPQKRFLSSARSAQFRSTMSRFDPAIEVQPRSMSIRCRSEAGCGE